MYSLPFAIERDRGGVHQVREERLDGVVGIDLEERDRNLLAAAPRKRDENVAVGVDGGVGDGVQIVGDGNRDDHLRVADRTVGGDHHRTGGRAFRDAGDHKSVGADDDGAVDLPKLNARAFQFCGAQTAAVDADFATRQGRGGGYALDVRLPVYVFLAQQTKSP